MSNDPINLTIKKKLFNKMFRAINFVFMLWLLTADVVVVVGSAAGAGKQFFVEQDTGNS